MLPGQQESAPCQQQQRPQTDVSVGMPCCAAFAMPDAGILRVRKIKTSSATVGPILLFAVQKEALIHEAYCFDKRSACHNASTVDEIDPRLHGFGIFRQGVLHIKAVAVKGGEGRPVAGAPTAPALHPGCSHEMDARPAKPWPPFAKKTLQQGSHSSGLHDDVIIQEQEGVGATGQKQAHTQIVACRISGMALDHARLVLVRNHQHLVGVMGGVEICIPPEVSPVHDVPVQRKLYSGISHVTDVVVVSGISD